MKRTERDTLFQETLRSEATGSFKLKKQTGGPGQFAIVDLRIRPLSRGEGFAFTSSVVEGRIPAQFIPAAEKGVREALVRGPLAGFPVVDVAVEVFDGKFHKKDSHAHDFQMAGRKALQEAISKADPMLLEPFGAFEILCPVRTMGTVLGLLGQKRARVRGTDFRDGTSVILAEIPLLEAEPFEFQLRRITSGKAGFSGGNRRYHPMPEPLARRFIEGLERKKE